MLSADSGVCALSTRGVETALVGSLLHILSYNLCEGKHSACVTEYVCWLGDVSPRCLLTGRLRAVGSHSLGDVCLTVTAEPEDSGLGLGFVHRISAP